MDRFGRPYLCTPPHDPAVGTTDTDILDSPKIDCETGVKSGINVQTKDAPGAPLVVPWLGALRPHAAAQPPPASKESQTARRSPTTTGLKGDLRALP